MKIQNQYKLTLFEGILWVTSVFVIVVTCVLSSTVRIETVVASLIGATALIYVSKGLPVGQLLTVVFSVFYGYISFSFHYYGEMITYLGMSAPIAFLAWLEWLRHPYQKGQGEVKIKRLKLSDLLFLFALATVVTLLFGVVLCWLKTPNLLFSTISVTTSFLAASLTFLRSPYYALAYAANDVILIILWIFASVENSGYIPMIVCFLIFFINDCYGFYNWKRLQRKQRESLSNCEEKETI